MKGNFCKFTELTNFSFLQGALEILGDGDSKGPPSETLSQEEHTPNTEEMEVKVDRSLNLFN